MNTDLIDILNARQGIICFVGAGGKKTTMYRLAREHPGRIGITATSHIEYFPKKLDATRYIASEDELFQLIATDSESRVIAFAKPSRRHGRRAGINPDRIAEFKSGGHFDVLLVKSDGARSRWVKAPAEHEPPLPPDVDTVVPIVSARVFGSDLTAKTAHRIEHICAITGMHENDRILPHHVAKLLSSPEGGLKNTADAKVIPLINMVDNPELEKLAREAATGAMALTDRIDSIVLAAMREESPVRDIIRHG